MAAKTAKMLNDFDISDKNDRLLMNKLRDCGLEYVSTNGKIIPAKSQPEHFCHCPQKCKSKLPLDKWDELFERFYNMGDQSKQNQFLQSHIVIKAVHLHNWESDKSSSINKRRVTCKYHVPNLNEDSDLEDYINRKGSDSIEVCQKAFMNCYGITEKRVRMQREKCISRLAPDHYKHSQFGKKQKAPKDKIEGEMSNLKIFQSSLEQDIAPLDLSNDKRKRDEVEGANKIKKKEICTNEENSKDQPLDLSTSNQSSRSTDPPALDFDKTSLYEIAKKMGVSKEIIDREIAYKYEEYLWKNLKKSQKELFKMNQKSLKDRGLNFNYKTEIENRSPSRTMENGGSIDSGDETSILTMQSHNTGDSVIASFSNFVPKTVGNMDIMRVNSFFQNQLWQPELIGLSSWKKLRNQTYDT